MMCKPDMFGMKSLKNFETKTNISKTLIAQQKKQTYEPFIMFQIDLIGNHTKQVKPFGDLILQF